MARKNPIQGMDSSGDADVTGIVIIFKEHR